MSVHEVVKQILSCYYVAISFTAVCTIPVIGGVELGMDENEEWVGNGDDSFSAERKVKMANDQYPSDSGGRTQGQ